MSQPLKCVLLLSLEEIALRRLVATLWTDSDMLVSLKKAVYSVTSIKKWESIIDRMKDKIMKLELPESLTKRMFDLIRPIGLNIKRWEDFHVETFNFSCIEIFQQDSAKLCFTTAGTVDDRRMAQEIIRCDTIDVVQRYLVACMYWLEDYIPLFWEEFTEEYKEHFSDRERIFDGLEFSWPHVFKDGQFYLDHTFMKSGRRLTSFNQWAFEHSAEKGHEATAKYFGRKLSLEEKEASLRPSARQAGRAVFNWNPVVSKRYSDVLLYLLSLMTPEQQIEIVEELPASVITCFLGWPQRGLFSENAGLICPRLPIDHDYRFLLIMVKYRVVIWENYFPKFFSEFFKHSPPHFKNYFVNHDTGFLDLFFSSGEAESISALFRNLDAAERVKLLFRFDVLKLFYDEMSRGRWYLVELCLQEATLSEEERKRLDKTFRSYLPNQMFVAGCFPFSGLKRRKMDPTIPPLKLYFDFLNKPCTSAEKEQKGQKRKLEASSLE